MENNNITSSFTFVEESWCADTIAARAIMPRREQRPDPSMERPSALIALEHGVSLLDQGFAVAYGSIAAAVRGVVQLAGTEGLHLISTCIRGDLREALRDAEARGVLRARWFDPADFDAFEQQLPSACAIWVDSTPGGLDLMYSSVELEAFGLADTALLIGDASGWAPTEQDLIQSGADVIVYGHSGVIASDSEAGFATVVCRSFEMASKLLEQRAPHETLPEQQARLALPGVRSLAARLHRAAQIAQVIHEQLQHDDRVSLSFHWYQPAAGEHPAAPTAVVLFGLHRPTGGSLLSRLPDSWRQADPDGLATYAHWEPASDQFQGFGADGTYELRVGTECPRDLWDELSDAITEALK